MREIPDLPPDAEQNGEGEGEGEGSGREHWEDLADRLGGAYLRYSFTKGTRQEVDFLVGALGLEPGIRVLDVGCGPGRHSHELARRGIEAVGVDISERFVALATEHAPAGAPAAPTFLRCDARELAFHEEFDAAISLCQGGMGLGGDDPIAGDLAVLDGIRRALRPGGRVAVSAFNAYFQVRWLEDHDTFDAATGVNHETTEIRDESGARHAAELWTTCSTPRELRLLFDRAHLTVDAVHSVEPGRYAPDPPSIDTPELLVIGHRTP
jgi:SAM-dependent methyltransferase